MKFVIIFIISLMTITSSFAKELGSCAAIDKKIKAAEKMCEDLDNDKVGCEGKSANCIWRPIPYTCLANNLKSDADEDACDKLVSKPEKCQADARCTWGPDTENHGE